MRSANPPYRKSTNCKYVEYKPREKNMATEDKEPEVEQVKQCFLSRIN